jgi:hypothetical protein
MGIPIKQPLCEYDTDTAQIISTNSINISPNACSTYFKTKMVDFHGILGATGDSCFIPGLLKSHENPPFLF